jgi:hypothetical protein
MRNGILLTLPDKKDWILNRIVDNDWLRDEFIEPCSMGKVTWNQRAIRVVHLISGQPARGTELLGLRHSNTQRISNSPKDLHWH